jgi:hypothetical protein
VVGALLGNKGLYFYKGLVKRKSGAAAANTEGRTYINMFRALAGGLGNFRLYFGWKCVRIGARHTAQDQHKQA